VAKLSVVSERPARRPLDRARSHCQHSRRGSYSRLFIFLELNPCGLQRFEALPAIGAQKNARAELPPPAPQRPAERKTSVNHVAQADPDLIGEDVVVVDVVVADRCRT